MKFKNKQLEAIIPKYTILPLLSCLMINCAVYYGLGIFTASRKHYDFTTSLDRMVPLVPEFVVIYLGCYVFWVINYILIAKQGKEYCMRFVTADMLSRLISGVFFILIPTTNIRPIIEGTDLCSRLLLGVYQADNPVNLFPSIHCLVSWFCYIGIRGRKEIPKLYQGFSCIFAILVFVSTQVTKQHYFIDIIGGVLIAEATFYIGFHTNLYRITQRLFLQRHKFEYEE